MSRLRQLEIESRENGNSDKKILLDNLITTTQIDEIEDIQIEGLLQSPKHYQKIAINWMIQREKINDQEIHPMFDKIITKYLGKDYINK